MTFNRPEPSIDLRNKVFEVAENVSDQTDIYWSDDSAIILSEKVVIEVYPDSNEDDGFYVQYKDLIGSWTELE